MQSIKVYENKYINFCRGKACNGKSFISHEPSNLCYNCQTLEAKEKIIYRKLMDIAEENKYPYTMYEVKGVKIC